MPRARPAKLTDLLREVLLGQVLPPLAARARQRRREAELAAQAAESAGRVGEAVQAEITRAVRASETAQGQAAMLLEAGVELDPDARRPPP